jgi:hypothetical protein
MRKQWGMKIITKGQKALTINKAAPKYPHTFSSAYPKKNGYLFGSRPSISRFFIGDITTRPMRIQSLFFSCFIYLFYSLYQGGAR